MLTDIDVRTASARISKFTGSVIVKTPTLKSEMIDSIISQMVGRSIEIHFKCENLQPVGSFKIRGALNFALSLLENSRNCGLVTHSSGNHGIAVAAAASILKKTSVVVVPKGAPQTKMDMIQKYGAELAYCEPTLESREQVCNQISLDRDMAIVPPFDHHWTMAGQGSMAIEISEQVPELDAILVAVGGCGMISGIATSLKAKQPHVRIYGIEPDAVDDTKQSVLCGHRTGPTNENASTICDALRVNPPGELCFPIVQQKVDGIMTVSDAQVIDAMRILWSQLGQMTEPSGACATAGLFTDEFVGILKSDINIKNVCVVVCGGNIEDSFFHELIGIS